MDRVWKVHYFWCIFDYFYPFPFFSPPLPGNAISLIRPEFCQRRGYCNSSRRKVIVSEAWSFALSLSFSFIVLLLVLSSFACLCSCPFVTPSATEVPHCSHFEDLFESEGINSFCMWGESRGSSSAPAYDHRPLNVSRTSHFFTPLFVLQQVPICTRSLGFLQRQKCLYFWVLSCYRHWNAFMSWLQPRLINKQKAQTDQEDCLFELTPSEM